MNNLFFTTARQNMIRGQLIAHHMLHPGILNAMMSIPRELFVHERSFPLIYADQEILLKGNRFLFEPLIEAKLLQLATPKKTDFVLNLQTGTGYSAFLLAQMTQAVVALEEDGELCAKAQKILNHMKVDNIAFFEKNVHDGFESQAPFDLIFIDGIVSSVPEHLYPQLAENGTLVCVVAEPPAFTGTAFKILKKDGKILVFQEFTILLKDFCHTQNYKKFSFSDVS